MLKRIIARSLLVATMLLGGVASAAAQGQCPSGRVIGNANAADGQNTCSTLTSLFDRALGSAQGSIITRQGSAWVVLTPGTSGLPLLSAGAGANLAYGVLGAAAGGTGQSSYTIGDILQASASTTLSKLAAVATGNALISGGVGTVSSWGKIGLTTHVSGILPLANGGTNASLTADNGAIVFSNAGGFQLLASTATAGQIVRSGASTSPTWSTATYPSTVTVNRLLYASASNVISDLATANNGVLITSAGGVPSISSSLPAGLTIDTVAVFSIRNTAASFDLAFVSTDAAMSARRTLTWDTLNGSRTITLAGNLAFGGAFTTSGNFASTFTMTGTTTVTFPQSGTLAILGANTFTASQNLTLSQDGLTSYTITNVNAGVSADAAYVATNANGNAYFGIGGANYTGITLAQNRAFIVADAALAGIVLHNVGDDPIVFALNGAQRGLFQTTGNATTSGVLTLGLTGSLTGSIGLLGSTSGVALIVAQAAAGTPTLTIGTTSGTIAASATSPLAISATTGVITCTTCGVTGTGLGQFASTTSAQLATVISDETGTAGKLVFDTSPTFQTSVVVSNNATTVTPPTSALLHLSAPNTTNPPALSIDAYGGFGFNLVRRANGTAASPTGLVAADLIGGFASRGYHSGGAYSTVQSAAVFFASTETWSSTANGSEIQFYTTPNTTATVTKVWTMLQTGGLAGTINIASTSSTTGSITSGGGFGAVGAIWAGTYVATGVVAVASLPTCGAGIKGARMFANNATATTFASTVAGGGANNVPVICDGTNWIIGSFKPANDNWPGSAVQSA